MALPLLITCEHHTNKRWFCDLPQTHLFHKGDHRVKSFLTGFFNSDNIHAFPFKTPPSKELLSLFDPDSAYAVKRCKQHLAIEVSVEALMMFNYAKNPKQARGVGGLSYSQYLPADFKAAVHELKDAGVTRLIIGLAG